MRYKYYLRESIELDIGRVSISKWTIYRARENQNEELSKIIMLQEGKSGFGDAWTKLQRDKTVGRMCKMGSTSLSEDHIAFDPKNRRENPEYSSAVYNGEELTSMGSG